MLPLLALSALATGGSAAFQFINGLKQQRQADAINPVRPTYTVPTEVGQATATAQNLANGPMAGFGQNLARLNANTASTVRAAQDSGSPNNALAVIAAAGDSQNNATNNLYQQNAQFQRQGAQALIAQLGTQAGYEDKAWDYNQRKPYEEKAAAKSALTQAGLTNMNSGLAGLGSAITQGARGFMGGAAGDDGLGGYRQLATRTPALNAALPAWAPPSMLPYR